MTKRLAVCAAVTAVFVALSPAPDRAAAQEPGADPTDGGSGQVVSYEPTPIRIVFRMLELADVTDEDVVVDLGSGDGRVVVAAAARHGARGVGYEIQSHLVERARENAERAGVSDRVRFYERDLFEADLSEATVVTLFLWEDVNVKLRPKLIRELPPGASIISHMHEMGDWDPDTTITVPTEEEGYGGSTRVHRWYVPADTLGLGRSRDGHRPFERTGLVGPRRACVPSYSVCPEPSTGSSR